MRQRRQTRMSTWWEERAALVTEAARIVADQTDCTPTDALAQLRMRAEATETDLEAIATSVLALRALFDRPLVAVT
jgi:hypothetical protein